MNVKMFLPNAKFFIGVLIVLAVTVFAMRAAGANTMVLKVRDYLGLST
jgi:hypothetical protein